MSPYEILSKIDLYFFKQYLANKTQLNGYYSTLDTEENTLSISDNDGNNLFFEIIENELKISGNGLNFTVDINGALLELVDYFSNLIATSYYWQEIREINKQPRQHKTYLTSLTARQVRILSVIPNNNCYYDGKKFVGNFWCSSKNLARKINNRLGI